jgi:hypothetical protein
MDDEQVMKAAMGILLVLAGFWMMGFALANCVGGLR